VTRWASRGALVLVPCTLVLASWGVLALACGLGADRSGPTLAELPEGVGLETLDARLAQERADRLAALERARADPATTPERLAQAYGDVGLWHHVYAQLAVATVAYRNAAQLVPDDVRWPYYLADIAVRVADLEAARAAYARAIELRPDYVPSYVRLAGVELHANRPDAAEPLLARALELDPDNPRALTLRGRLALDRAEFAAAVSLLTRALEGDPDGIEIHGLLGNAYRGAGDLEAAQRHLRLTQELPRQLRHPVLEDPLMASLDQIGRSSSFNQNRGHRLMLAGRYAEAAAHYREAVAAAPEDMSARINLGAALAHAGQPLAAIETLEELLRLHPAQPPHPDLALANLGLATVLEAQQRNAEAELRYRESLRSDPDQPAANARLAQLLLREARPEESLAAFERAIERDPADAGLRFGRATALVLLERHADAAAALEADLRAVADSLLLRLLLARLLAASPDAALRDGARSLALAEALHAERASVATAETLAMAHAERGDFEGALGWQLLAVETVEAAGTAHVLRERLDGYRAGRPCREPWLLGESVALRFSIEKDQ
jgi:tetratricopeptide (TPR) repeat protein